MWQRPIVGVSLGLIALVIAYSAHLQGRPISAALTAIFGVVVVGALLGLRAGAAAGIAASLAYNLLFTDPFLKFSLSSADDLVPILALNFSAIASGLIAGRLHDRAVAAEASERKITELLRFSQDLQSAVTVRQVGIIAQTYFGHAQSAAQLFIEVDGQLRASSDAAWGAEAANEVWQSWMPSLTCGRDMGFLIKSPEGRLGVLVIQADTRSPAVEEINVFLPLLAMAIQRCQLAEQLALADAFKRSERLKTALLSSVSHDLRTPLAAISASASSLLRLGASLDEGTRTDLLETIEDQCARLDRLTANLLSLGRIEGGLEVDRMPVIDAIEVLGGTLARVRKLGAGHVIHRSFNIASALVRADEALLEQVFFNVLENALLHTPPDTSIRVTAALSDGWVRIAVEDDGLGIPQHDYERVFERFYQVRPNARPGSGLGLSIAKGFTELVGGTISAGRAAPPMRGAEIEVRIPVMAASS